MFGIMAAELLWFPERHRAQGELLEMTIIRGSFLR